jgi:hypothetical protein
MVYPLKIIHFNLHITHKKSINFFTLVEFIDENITTKCTLNSSFFSKWNGLLKKYVFFHQIQVHM